MIKIVTRHSGAIRWLQSRGIKGEIIEHLDPDEIKSGDEVYGILPVHLIHQLLEKGARVYLLVLPALAFSQRGQELSPDEMEEAGAKIVEVKSLELEEV